MHPPFGLVRLGAGPGSDRIVSGIEGSLDGVEPYLCWWTCSTQPHHNCGTSVVEERRERVQPSLPVVSLCCSLSRTRGEVGRGHLSTSNPMLVKANLEHVAASAPHAWLVTGGAFQTRCSGGWKARAANRPFTIHWWNAAQAGRAPPHRPSSPSNTMRCRRSLGKQREARVCAVRTHFGFVSRSPPFGESSRGPSMDR